MGARPHLSDPERTRLDRGFFGRPPDEVAPELLGRTLVRLFRGRRLSGRIAETEAYARDDPASHSFTGPTARNATMFADAGRLYVYRSYGVHACCNVVTGTGEGSAVLIRALEPLEGIEVMRRHRAWRSDRELCAGPGRLTQALGIGLDADGWDLIEGSRVWIEAGEPVGAGDVIATERVGIRRAADRPWRFVARGDPWVSRRVTDPSSAP